MCGRFVIAKEISAVADLFEVENFPVDANLINYNIAPTTKVPIILEREIESLPVREIHLARWGLMSANSKDFSGPPLFNARAETVLTKPSFAEAALSKRCAIPASGYFEWQASGDEKTPFFIHAPDQMICFAGIYSWWRDETKAVNDPSRWVLTCSILTQDSPDNLAKIHDRSPVFLHEDALDAWISPDYQTTDQLIRELQSESSEVASGLEFHKVSAAVGSVKNNSAELISKI
ncbi:MAG: SOS response-associated peptidase [Aquiluna sp.]|nr:SOS response-associated peptidase [Aquiluna sp.]